MTPLAQVMRVAVGDGHDAPTQVITPLALIATWPFARIPVGVSTVPVISLVASPAVTVQIAGAGIASKPASGLASGVPGGASIAASTDAASTVSFASGVFEGLLPHAVRATTATSDMKQNRGDIGRGPYH